MTNVLPNNSFATADLHFGDPVHARKYGFDCTKKWAEMIVTTLNQKLVGDEELFMLGDIICDADYIHYLNQINCRKIHYVLGNRESRCPSIVQGLFEAGYIPVSSLRYKRVLLTHIPPHSSEMHKFDVVFHGHLHTDRITNAKYRNVSHPIQKGRLVSLDVELETL